MAEELTVIANSEHKVAELERMADHIPSTNPSEATFAAPTIAEDPPRPPKTSSAAIDEHVLDYRVQESERYQKCPTLPYSYYDRRTGQYCTVGPALRPGPGGDRKMRDHPLLISERPAHVNIKNLVIDAVARLPLQAGTRLQVCEKIKDSQYLVSTATEAQISSCVGGALDRMQAEKWDPAVIFDTDRKLWVYLHSDRTVENWKEKSRELQVCKRQSQTAQEPSSESATEPAAPTNPAKVEPSEQGGAYPGAPQEPPASQAAASGPTVVAASAYGQSGAYQPLGAPSQLHTLAPPIGLAALGQIATQSRLGATDAPPKQSSWLSN